MFFGPEGWLGPQYPSTTRPLRNAASIAPVYVFQKVDTVGSLIGRRTLFVPSNSTKPPTTRSATTDADS